jgi:hypothetical protein
MSRLFKTEAEKAKEYDVSREQFFDESRFDAEKARYGLFSFPGPLAVSDNSIGQHHIPERSPDGLVISGPRNITARGTKTGRTSDVFFDKANYLHEGDRYVDMAKLERKQVVVRAQTARRVHDNIAFKPGGKIKVPYLAYEYMPQTTHKKIHRRIGPGEVYTEPKNITTQPMKKGAPNCYPKTTLGPYNEHLTDEYDRRRAKDLREAKDNRAKMGEAPFKRNYYGGKPINNDK